MNKIPFIVFNVILFGILFATENEQVFIIALFTVAIEFCVVTLWMMRRMGEVSLKQQEQRREMQRKAEEAMMQEWADSVIRQIEKRENRNE